MLLSGQVPAELGRALHEGELMAERDGIDLWAVHPGGRSVLDAVQKGLDLPEGALAASREVLSCSSAQHVVGDGDVCAASG